MLELLSGLLEVTKLQVTKLRFRSRSVDLKLLAVVPHCVPDQWPLYPSHLLGPQVKELNFKLEGFLVSLGQLGSPLTKYPRLGA